MNFLLWPGYSKLWRIGRTITGITLKHFKLTILISILMLGTAWGQVRGNISGQVRDAVSGETLVGVNVIVLNSSLGASTNVDGRFFINNIIPGSHTLMVSMIGYGTLRMQQVEVLPDLTTSVEIELAATSLEGEEVVVVAERPLVRKDATTKMVSVSRAEIASAPIQDFSGLLETQSNIDVLSGTPIAKSGYNDRGIDDVRLRGGRNNEVALMIDGVKVSNPLFGGFGTNISVNAIEQLTIASGGFNAKYGNALSGVINLSTREGTENWDASMKYMSSDPFGLGFLTNEKGRAQANQQWQGMVSGPLPFLNKASILTTLDASTKAGTVYEYDNVIWDDIRVTDIDGDGVLDTLPTSEEIFNGYVSHVNLDSVYPGLAGSWDEVYGPDGREVNPLDKFAGWQGFGWNNSLNLFTKVSFYPLSNMKASFSYLGDSRYRQFNSANAYYIYNMGGQNVQFLQSNKFTLSINQTLSPKFYWNVILSRFDQKREIRILRDYENKFSDGLFGIFRPPDEYDKNPDEYIAVSADESIRDPFESSFYLLADNRWYDDENSTNYEFRGDFTWNPVESTTIESGIQVNQLEIDYSSYQNVSGVDPFPTIYSHSPIEAACYVQTKYEWKHIITNLGFRVDAANANAEFWADPMDPLGTQDFSNTDLEYNSISESKTKIKLSPRLGVALPLTDKTIAHFNFGHFYQNPNYRDLYRASGDNREISMIRGNIIGNPHLEHEKSVQYEIGLQHQVGEIAGLEFTVWQKESSNQVGSVVVGAYQDEGHDNPYSYSIFLNNNSGFARGADVSVNLRTIGPVSGSMHYSWSESYVLQATSWDGYWDGNSLDSGPRRETRSPWDQTHTLRFLGTLRSNQNFGPRLSEVYPFGDILISMIQRISNGYPYTPYVPGNTAVETYSRRWPLMIRTDLKMFKGLEIMGQDLKLTLEVKNLFDRKNILSGYTRTGSATDPGTSSWYTLSSTYWDSRNNNNYALSRTILFGLEIVW
ncbi:MAG: TonB-dependent receptor [Candidatus Marinimicrobia bacterium]|jgi:outer membrane receptor protein involved in Fe transport|nr:TonB-dependent receptor [Candidatus Neomarinimicrobiota bacterium]